jgi:hypothetical protein
MIRPLNSELAVFAAQFFQLTTQLLQLATQLLHHHPHLIGEVWTCPIVSRLFVSRLFVSRLFVSRLFVPRLAVTWSVVTRLVLFNSLALSPLLHRLLSQVIGD